jgi:CrcB protein
MGATTARIEMHPALRDGLAVGVLGGYTTFSTLMYQSLRQLETGSPTAAVLNLTGSVAIGIAATFAGLALGRTA